MKNKGFTLIELMAVIVILGIVVTFTSIIVVNQIDKSKQRISDATLKIIYSASDSYVDENINDFPKVANNNYCIKISDLIKSNLIEKTIIDNEKDITENYFVKVTYKSNYEYEIVEECTESNWHKFIN